jgi:starch synthase
MNEPNFAINYLGDGYSTSKKIMGRQSAGKALMRGAARKWQNNIINGYGTGSANAMVQHLKSEGFLSKVRWFDATAKSSPQGLNAVYYPAPPTKAMAQNRNRLGPGSFSIFGVTHTLSSTNAMDQIADLILPPFQPWDALICTSSAALHVVDNLHDQARTWWSTATGASRFNPITKVVIPLGVNAPDFVPKPGHRATVRHALGINDDDICFLFSGRMVFHAKANPVAFYQAIEAASQKLNTKLICIEAGIYPNESAQHAFQSARTLFAPSASFIAVDGADQTAYDGAWAAADVFVSLSDNIQETFGITPLEAMAAGLPVIVSDWNGYKDTVRDGVDGFRIPVLMPSAGVGGDLALRHDEDVDSYDYYIGRVSMATVIDVGILTQRMMDLAQNQSLRQSMGLAGQRRVTSDYDWPVILGRYTDLATELAAMRARAKVRHDVLPRPNRPDPYALFAHYPTSVLSGDMRVATNPALKGQIETFLELGIARFAIDPVILPREAIIAILVAAETHTTVAQLLAACPQFDAKIKTHALMWLAKMGLLILSAQHG